MRGRPRPLARKVLEGLRLLAAWQEAIRRGLRPYKNCEQCMEAAPLEIRQSWKCGYEPPAPENLREFAHAPCPEGAARPAGLVAGDAWPTVCPGYSTSLPETIEIARAWVHWDKGSLRAYSGERPPTEALVDGVEIFGGAVEELKSKLMTPRSKGGMGDG